MEWLLLWNTVTRTNKLLVKTVEHIRACLESQQAGSGGFQNSWVGSGRVGSGRVGSGRVGSGRVGSGRIGSGRVG